MESNNKHSNALAVLLLGDDVNLAELLQDVPQHTACRTAHRVCECE